MIPRNHQPNIGALPYHNRVVHPTHWVQYNQPDLIRRHQMPLVEEHDIERVWIRAGLHCGLQVERLR